MLINSQAAFNKIKKTKALCAFNFSTIELAEAIVKICSRLKTSFILQTSPGETQFLHPSVAQTIASTLTEKYKIPFSLNLDHGRDLNLIKQCLRVGYTSIHFDGSNLSLKENIEMTKRVVSLCRKRKIGVEGEVGEISGQSSLEKSTQESRLTSPKEALQFIKETEVDFLAISIGEKHGLGKPNLQFNLLKRIVQSIKVPLVLHGGSGISATDLKKAIKLGIKKVNFNTELRLAWASALKDYLSNHPQEIVPYKILASVQEKVAQVVEEKLKICTI